MYVLCSSTMQLRYHVLEASFSPGFIAPNVPPMIVAVGLCNTAESLEPAFSHCSLTLFGPAMR